MELAPPELTNRKDRQTGRQRAVAETNSRSRTEEHVSEKILRSSALFESKKLPVGRYMTRISLLILLSVNIIGSILQAPSLIIIQTDLS
jgi:hypothetical protein